MYKIVQPLGSDNTWTKDAFHLCVIIIAFSYEDELTIGPTFDINRKNITLGKNKFGQRKLSMKSINIDLYGVHLFQIVALEKARTFF